MSGATGRAASAYCASARPVASVHHADTLQTVPRGGVGYTGRHTVNRPREDRGDAGSLHESNAMTIDHNIEAVRQACTRHARPGSCQLVQQVPDLLEISFRVPDVDKSKRSYDKYRPGNHRIHVCHTPVASGATGIQCRKLCPEGMEDKHHTSVTRNFHDRAPVHSRLRESYPLAKRLNPSTLMHTTIF